MKKVFVSMPMKDKMTNREKYINNASDEELITRLGCNSCIYKDND